MTHTTCDDSEFRKSQDDARYFREQYERLAEEQRQCEDDARRQRETSRRERQQEYFDSLRTASTWPEALQNQAILFDREVYLEDDNDPDEDHYFSLSAKACRQALEFWPQEEALVAYRITELEQEIADIRRNIAVRVSERLKEWNSAVPFLSLAGTLLDTEESDLDSWLNW